MNETLPNIAPEVHQTEDWETQVTNKPNNHQVDQEAGITEYDRASSTTSHSIIDRRMDQLRETLAGDPSGWVPEETSIPDSTVSVGKLRDLLRRDISDWRAEDMGLVGPALFVSLVADVSWQSLPSKSDRKVVAKRVQKTSENPEDSVCTICHEEMEYSVVKEGTNESSINNKHIAVKLECQHIFGSECVIKWYSEHGAKTCPICRKVMVLEAAEEGYPDLSLPGEVTGLHKDIRELENEEYRICRVYRQVEYDIEIQGSEDLALLGRLLQSVRDEIAEDRDNLDRRSGR
ncbi:hypothetical protein BU16DRAFT_580940 [Lophium mytilinum]|uniref:RING-type domain-containing protein n=1 Tax=Lophium mytilinum TaxID=390894 RepID=A0A6A6QZ81_9PEZI|nr:hypothetical protein BU16DRAFT_580940 [Lophium mytilinum]